MILPEDWGEKYPYTWYPTIPSGLLNRLAKLTSRKPNFHSERVDNVYPDPANALREAEPAHLIFSTMGEWWKGQDE